MASPETPVCASEKKDLTHTIKQTLKRNKMKDISRLLDMVYNTVHSTSCLASSMANIPTTIASIQDIYVKKTFSK